MISISMLKDILRAMYKVKIWLMLLSLNLLIHGRKKPCIIPKQKHKLKMC